MTTILKFTRDQGNGMNHSDQNNDDYCEMTVAVKEKRYTNPEDKVMYELSYSYRYIGEAAKLYNPFYTHFPTYEDEKNMRPGSDGEIIVKNGLTERLVQFLLMPCEELAPIIGFTYPEDYKIHILQMISRLWD